MTADWSRPHWKSTSRPTSLFYFIPGEPSGELKLSRSRHHIEGFPDGLELSAHKRSDNPEWFAGFFVRPGLGSGMDKTFGDQAGEVGAVEQGTVVRGEFADSPDLGYLRDSIGVVSAILDQGGLGVLDLFSAHWLSRDEWFQRFVHRTGFRVFDHVQILVSDDEAVRPGLWVHTRGMRKFGRPDLQIRHVPGPWTENNPWVEAAGDVLNSLAEYLCRGAVVRNGEVLAFPGRQCRCTFLLTPDDTDSESCHFSNEVLEVVDVIGKKPAADLNRLLGEVSGG